MEEKYENMIWLGLILLMIILSSRTYLTSQELSCDKCFIEVSNYRNSNITVPEFAGRIQAMVLFEEWKNGRCLLTWEKSQGFGIVQNLTEP